MPASRLALLFAPLLLAAFVVADVPEPNDLALIPADGRAFVSVRVADLWRSAAVKKAIPDAKKDDPKSEDPAALMEKELGLRPDEVERVSVAYSADGRVWVVVRTLKPYDDKKLLSRLRGAKPAEYQGKRYHVGTDRRGREVAVWPADPRVFVVGPAEGVKGGIALAGGGAKGPLGPILDRCRASKHHVFAGVDGKRLGGFKDNQLFKWVMPIETAWATVNVTNMAEVVFHATAPSEKQAEALLRGAEPFLLHAPEFFTTVLDYEVASDLPELIRDVMTEWKGKEVVVRSVGDPGRLAISLLLLACASAEYRKDEEPLLEIRSRFGVNRVEVGGSRSGGFFYPLTRLVHGNTMHAKQFEVVGLESVPTAYYHRHGPVGQVFRTYNTDPTRAFAVLDLGGGTMASYGLPGQTVDFFEVDPALADISFHSHRYFSFVREAERSRANVSLIVGDARSTFTTKAAQARLKPNRERGESLPGSFKYRLVVVDTLGPSPRPGHMAAKVTREAVRGYFDRLEEDGVVLIHISSRFFDLQPVLANVAADLGLAGYHWSDSDSDIVGKNSSHWVALARKPAHLDKVLSVPRWTADLDQLALLGAALWPSHGHTSYQAASGLCHAAQALADLQAQQAHREEGLAGDPRLVRAGWEPLETTAELRRFEADVPGRLRGLDSRRADWNKRLAEPGLAPASKAWLAARVAAVEKETTRLKARLAEVPGKHRHNAKVGVWTDKSANLLDVFAR